MSGMMSGCVYWITGLSNTGKTTLGVLLTERLRRQGVVVAHLDGDRLRDVYGETAVFDIEGRKKIAFRNARLCALLAEQGITVVCSTISLFHEVQKWNRENIRLYKEIYLRSPLSVLQQRDHRQVYQEQSLVAGRDYAPEEPKSPDLVLESDNTRSPEELLSVVSDALLSGALA
jgi:cytidine diphosphoramidate kinase